MTDNIMTLNYQRKGNRVVKLIRYSVDDNTISYTLRQVLTISSSVPFNFSYIDTIKREICGSPEYFTKLKIGTYTYLVSETGMDKILLRTQTKCLVSEIQSIAKEHGLRSTILRKKLLQAALIEEMVIKRKMDLDNPDLIPEIVDMTEKQLQIKAELYIN